MGARDWQNLTDHEAHKMGDWQPKTGSTEHIHQTQTKRLTETELITYREHEGHRDKTKMNRTQEGPN